MVCLIGPEKPNVSDDQHDRKISRGKRKKEIKKRLKLKSFPKYPRAPGMNAYRLHLTRFIPSSLLLIVIDYDYSPAAFSVASGP